MAGVSDAGSVHRGTRMTILPIDDYGCPIGMEINEDGQCEHASVDEGLSEYRATRIICGLLKECRAADRGQMPSADECDFAYSFFNCINVEEYDSAPIDDGDFAGDFDPAELEATPQDLSGIFGPPSPQPADLGPNPFGSFNPFQRKDAKAADFKKLIKLSKALLRMRK